MRELVPRHARQLVREALADTRVVGIVGPRQAGKSTLAALVAAQHADASVLSLDDLRQREAAEADPEGFVRRPGLTVIDEIQRVPELLLAIKAAVDRDARPGRFLLTGSAHPFAVREVRDFLAGRLELIELWPFSQGEVERREEAFVDALLDGSPLTGSSPHDKADYVRRACAGGFPEVLPRPERRRTAWFHAYVEATAERVVPDVAHLSRLDELPRFLELLAARHARLLNVARLSRDAEIPERTAHRYVSALEAAFLVRRVGAWSTNAISRLTKAPKVVITDSGLAAHLRGWSPARLDRPELAEDVGDLLEGFVVLELIKQVPWSRARPRLYHFRDREGHEVDAVLESRDGRIAAVEVKASATVRKGMFRSLEMLRDALGRRFTAGVVLYTGTDVVPFGDRVSAAPISALWRSRSRPPAGHR